MLQALRSHWPEYLIEAAALGCFMIVAGTVATLLEYPGSPVRQAIDDPLLRRIPMGLAMGATAIAIIYSPWGKRSGAHLNPAVTLTFYRLGKIEPWDAAFYPLFQLAGGLVGVLLVTVVLGEAFSEEPVRYVATLPGTAGTAVAFVAEVGIATILMTVVLVTTNTPRLAPYTGLFAGTLVATYIAFEAPLSGMSLNPARSFASAGPAGLWHTLWIYFLAPPLGMLLASQLYLWGRGAGRVRCAKLQHPESGPCIFRCGYMGAEEG